ncbi:hypothetical protein ERO13_A05G373850v2 [Gossypium hirsutum]|uniref:Secreted protein n=1 Tax=Gossypium darwinii TaxID=34276 RepID=A0A5D2GQE9_GOSDA|nr:hypothetical protein ERO13_A05G373850v2 [Gossypium hirsutum]TYH20281.1 hypothetical protein ES288_A05G418700v1 [Gossypium darwinii]
MAVNQTAALKVGLCLLAFHGRISSLQPHFQHLPTCLCDCSSQPLLTIPEGHLKCILLVTMLRTLNQNWQGVQS